MPSRKTNLAGSKKKKKKNMATLSKLNPSNRTALADGGGKRQKQSGGDDQPLAKWSCPHCAAANTSVMPFVARRWAESGCPNCRRLHFRRRHPAAAAPSDLAFQPPRSIAAALPPRRAAAAAAGGTVDFTEADSLAVPGVPSRKTNVAGEFGNWGTESGMRPQPAMLAMEVEMEIKMEVTAETLATTDGIAAIAGRFASHAASTLPPVGKSVECQFDGTGWERGVVSRVDTAGTSQRFWVSPEGNPGAVWEEREEPAMCTGPLQSQSQWRLAEPTADTSSDLEGVDKDSDGGGESTGDQSARPRQPSCPAAAKVSSVPPAAMESTRTSRAGAVEKAAAETTAVGTRPEGPSASAGTSPDVRLCLDMAASPLQPAPGTPAAGAIDRDLVGRLKELEAAMCKLRQDDPGSEALAGLEGYLEAARRNTVSLTLTDVCRLLTSLRPNSNVGRCGTPTLSGAPHRPLEYHTAVGRLWLFLSGVVPHRVHEPAAEKKKKKAAAAETTAVLRSDDDQKAEPDEIPFLYSPSHVVEARRKRRRRGRKAWPDSPKLGS